jgi:hypothetical protein
MKNYFLRSANFEVLSRIKENLTSECDVLSSQHLLGAALISSAFSYLASLQMAFLPTLRVVDLLSDVIVLELIILFLSFLYAFGLDRLVYSCA